MCMYGERTIPSPFLIRKVSNIPMSDLSYLIR